MLTYQIRGGLGTQLLNLMAAYGDAYDKGKDIEKIILNFHNYPDGLREVNIDFISKTIEHHLKVEAVSGTKKFPIFNTERIQKVKKHIEKIRRAMPVKLNSIEPISETILHVRQLDRPLVSVNTYIDIIVKKDSLEPWIIIGDDMKTLQRIIDSSESFINHSRYDNDSVREWFMLCKSRLVVGGFSSYVLSAALLNPGLQYKMIKKGMCNEEHLTGYDWKCLDLFVELFDNINWMNYD
jgi:hypothetical protein